MLVARLRSSAYRVRALGVGLAVPPFANLRGREGARDGASSKRSLDLPAVGAHLAALGEALGWHGALALDAILIPDGPCCLHVNPRLVEPGDAWRAGVDLVEVLQVSLGNPPAPRPPAILASTADPPGPA